MINRFTASISHIKLPDQFPSPFSSEVHPVCKLAAEQVKMYLKEQVQWNEELRMGKMFGVLVIRDEQGVLGFLAAFSGNLAGKNIHPFFVPPVADLLNPNGFFKQGETVISSINQKIKEMEDDAMLIACRIELEEAKRRFNEEVEEAKRMLKQSKCARDKQREMNPTSEEMAEMVRESQHEKAEFRRLEKKWAIALNKLQEKYEQYILPIEELKTERKNRSACLQQRLFNEFQLLNIRGESKGLLEIFEHTAQRVPPAGAGECAGPKLLQYAFANGLKPIAMAEFWWGDSPRTEIRHHGYYYPACKGKCEPIMGHMLQGINLFFEKKNATDSLSEKLEVVYEDDWLLVINKPAGMLSAPGKTGEKSAIELVTETLTNGREAFLVHRLDMATSGLLLIAKDRQVYIQLQSLFEKRMVTKRYIALLDGLPLLDEGTIELPICPNVLDRPRQMVHYEYGKRAVTHYSVLERNETQTRVALFPITGRTHQLRVHVAHPEGLNCPIVGDVLYGKKADRLYLHAEFLELVHPVTNQLLRLEKKASF